MDLACQCQISSHPAVIIPALIIAEELSSRSGSTEQAILQISGLSSDFYPRDEVARRLIALRWYMSVGPHYWEFLDHPGRCGVLYNERAKCYTRIVNFWLLFLEALPDPEGPNPLIYRKIVMANWSRFLSKCVPGDKDLMCRLRDFTLDKACKEDVERVIAWLKVILQSIAYIFTCVLIVSQMDSNRPNDVLVRWRTYGSERYSLPCGIWDWLSFYGRAQISNMLVTSS